jgi:SAM-dependent methyltransferase
MTNSITPDEVHRQYADSSRLAARQLLWSFGSGPSLYEIVLDRAALRGTEVIADIGCGNGRYLSELRRRGHRGTVLGLDLFEAMARAAGTHGATAVADAQALPLADDSVDIAMSLHMLYHVPDIAAAINELRRVVRAGGQAIVATNGEGHTVEAKEILGQAATAVAGIAVDPNWDTRRFDTRIAERMLAAVFAEVEVIALGGRFPVPDPAILSAYLASWSPKAMGVEAGPVWDATLAEADRIIEARFARDPSFALTSRAAVLIAR